MRITSPAVLPKISTSDSASNHPKQSIFFDKVDVMDLAEEIDTGAQLVNVESEMPELSSITLKKKLYNTRIQNERQDLQ